jgi:hypothetical protein
MHGFPFPRRAGSEPVELWLDAVLEGLPLPPGCPGTGACDDVPVQAHVMAKKLVGLSGPGEPTGEAALTGVMAMRSARPRRGIIA